MAFRKLICMKYNDQIGECCRCLAVAHDVPTDAVLTHFINSQRLAEEIASTLGYDAPKCEQLHSRVEIVELSVKAFRSRLHNLRGSLPSKGAAECTTNPVEISRNCITLTQNQHR